MYLLKVDNNIGIIFGDKWKSDCNYVDTSKYFSSIYTANFSSSVSNPINTDFYICQFQESLGTTALFNALKVFENGTAIKLYSPEPSTSNFCSCSFTIVGQLIE